MSLRISCKWKSALLLDDQQIEHHSLLAKDRANGHGANRLRELEKWLKQRSLTELLGMIDELDDQDLAFIKEGIQFNKALADYGLKHGSGLGVGKTLQRLIRQRLVTNDMMTAARMLTSAAADARMAGVKLPAMSSAGSGNHGLTAILPIVAVKDFITAKWVSPNAVHLSTSVFMSKPLLSSLKACPRPRSGSGNPCFSDFSGPRPSPG